MITLGRKNVHAIEINVVLPIFWTCQLSAGQHGMKFLPKQLKTIGIIVGTIKLLYKFLICIQSSRP